MQIRDDSEKAALQHRKTVIQERFKEEMGLLVDVPKSGLGTTNDENTALRFFQNAAKSAAIMGLMKI
nr:unnamed protein product [Callosobruchus analis]